MSYQTVRCPQGHSFRANVYSRYQTLRCPRCSEASASASSFPGVAESAAPLFTPVPETPAVDAGFSSGGGGNFGGGGASGDW
jgi:uncharacterized membrane protein YgcG